MTTETKNNNGRFQYIDMAKGFAIILVIFGHVVSWEPICNVVFIKWYCSFIIPIFFVTSGFCCTRAYTLQKTFSRVLKPYYFWGAVGAVFGVYEQIMSGTGVWECLAGILSYVFGISTWNYPIWFLPVYFVARSVFDSFQVFIEKKTKGNTIAAIISTATFSLLCFAVGIGLSTIKEQFGLVFPFRFDIGLTMVVFISFGKGLREICTKRKFSEIDILVAAILLMAANCLIAHINALVSVSTGTYGNPILFIYGAMFGSVAILCIMKIVQNIKIINKCLSWYGRHSQLILCIQVFPLLIVSKIAHEFGVKFGINSIGIDFIAFILSVIAVVPPCIMIEKAKAKMIHRGQ